MGAFSRIDTTLKEPALRRLRQHEVDFTLAEEVVKTEIVNLFCNLDCTKEPSDFNECTLEELYNIYKMLEIQKDYYGYGSRQVSSIKENIPKETKKKITIEDMKNFICRYNNSISPEVLKLKTIEEIKALYQDTKEVRQKQEELEFNKSGLSRKRRRVYYD